jgi:prolyl-tRNA editing enzyme YbaK/EbsC (Cys-tRNA(Pro) deacylase)
MTNELSSSAKKVQDALSGQGFSFRVAELPASTRTAREAADAVGCRVEQIAKSLVFKGKQTGEPYLVIASGINRVDEKKFGKRVGEPIVKPDADYVRERTGFSIGGVPPVGHVKPIRTWIDEDLLTYDVIWAAAGTPNAVFELRSQDLQKLTNGEVVPVK